MSAFSFRATASEVEKRARALYGRSADSEVREVAAELANLARGLFDAATEVTSLEVKCVNLERRLEDLSQEIAQIKEAKGA